MVLASFQVEDKLRKIQFFQEIFLLVNISAEVVLGMLFLILSNSDIQFVEKKLTRRSYTTAKALPTTKQVELINKKKFVKAALDEKSETFVVYVTFLNLVSEIHPHKEAQIAFLLTKKVKIPNKYSDFTDVFSEEKTLVLPKHIKLNEHAINLEDSK